jgi:glycosyltransferase involved in cell wall biosynthesis
MGRADAGEGLAMKFSICIPNYNYEKFIGRTVKSVLDQTYGDFEIVVSDNASTDGSVKAVESFGDPRIKVRVNACNVGFAGNLDRAGRMASGDVMVMLSSDDVMRREALATYDAMYRALGAQWDRAILCATADVIDPEDRVTGTLPPHAELYQQADLVPGLPAPNGAKVYKIEGAELLRRCIKTMQNPFNFLATAYPRAIYEKVEGYGASRQVNPDKWFHWQIMAAGTTVYFIDHPLFAYRWHPTNQNSQELASGALKYLTDEYISTWSVSKGDLERLGLTREFLENAFVERDIARHGLATLARGQAEKAKRIYHFGWATFPRHVRANPKIWVLGALLRTGKVGSTVARLAYKASGRT